MTLALLCGVVGAMLGAAVGVLVMASCLSGKIADLERRLALLRQQHESDPMESPNDTIWRRAQERADALDIERVLTREETAAIDRMIGGRP